MGPKYNVQTCYTKFSGTQKDWGHVCLFQKGAEARKSDTQSMSQLRLVVAVKRRRRPYIPSIPIQSLHMGPNSPPSGLLVLGSFNQIKP